MAWSNGTYPNSVGVCRCASELGFSIDAMRCSDAIGACGSRRGLCNISPLGAAVCERVLYEKSVDFRSCMHIRSNEHFHIPITGPSPRAPTFSHHHLNFCSISFCFSSLDLTHHAKKLFSSVQSFSTLPEAATDRPQACQLLPGQQGWGH